MSYFDDHEDQITGLDVLDGRRRARRPSSLPYDQQPGIAPADRIWTTREGERIRMADMTQSHRTNTLRMLVRKHGDWVRTCPTGRALIACGVDEDEPTGSYPGP